MLDLAHPVLGIADVHILFDELIGVAVPRVDQHGDAVEFAGQRPDEVVRLVALQFHRLDRHHRKQLFEDGHLAHELGRHGLSRRLVFIVETVPEGGRMHIEGNGEILGVVLRNDFEEQLDKAEDAVRRQTVFVGEDPDCVECPIQQTVPVDQHKFLFFSHRKFSFEDIVP